MLKWDSRYLGIPSPAVDHSDTLGEGKNFTNMWEPLDSPQWSKNGFQPTQKTCDPTAPPLPGASHHCLVPASSLSPTSLPPFSFLPVTHWVGLLLWGRSKALAPVCQWQSGLQGQSSAPCRRDEL